MRKESFFWEKERPSHHKCDSLFLTYAKKCGVSLDEMAGLIPKSKQNIKLLKKISDMSEEEQERVLKILELMR